ncbi:MAG TPA: HEPN domain-containing protein, partial [Herpetosiphonaceae bacterium]|nr:HEPN domain-containing protein [Herpetosiphonaceae bacterium]
MSDISDVFLSKARESLEGATSELVNGRYNNAANRAYYACFQAAIAALDLAGIQPGGERGTWSHSFVQGQFVGELINRRKRYPTELRDALTHTQAVREQADYRTTGVSYTQATRAVSRAR